MARVDKRINVLVPSVRRRQYEELARKNGVPLATMAAHLLSIGYDTWLEGAEKVAARTARSGGRS